MFLEIMKEMDSPSDFPQAVYVANGAMLVLYAVCIVVGYGRYGNNVAGFLPATLPDGLVKRLVGVGLCYHICVSYLLTFQPLADKLKSMWHQHQQRQRQQEQRQRQRLEDERGAAAGSVARSSDSSSANGKGSTGVIVSPPSGQSGGESCCYEQLGVGIDERADRRHHFILSSLVLLGMVAQYYRLPTIPVPFAFCRPPRFYYCSLHTSLHQSLSQSNDADSLLPCTGAFVIANLIPFFSGE